MNAPASGPTAAPAMALLRGAALPTLGCLTLVIAGGAILGGGWTAASIAVGGALSVAALAVGPLVMHWGRSATPVGLMARAVLAYCLVVFVLGVVFAALGAVDGLEGTSVAVGVLTGCGVWLAGQIHTLRRLRLPVYELPAERPQESANR